MEGQSGYLFDLDCPTEEIADVIESNFRDSARYQELSLTAFQCFRSTLNWEVSGEVARQAIQEAIANPR